MHATLISLLAQKNEAFKLSGNIVSSPLENRALRAI
jgi:hypothetical protein